MIRSIQIPRSVELIKESAFRYCKLLSSIDFLGDKLAKIESFAFANTGIDTLIIPKSVKYIGEVAFGDCSKLLFVEFEKETQLKSIEKAVFYGSGIDFIKLPSSLEKIESGAFSHTRIKRVEIPKSVIYIGEKSFYNCRDLSDVFCFPLVAPVLGKDAFTYCSSLQKIRIPVNGIGYFDKNWEQCKNRIIYY